MREAGDRSRLKSKRPSDDYSSMTPRRRHNGSARSVFLPLPLIGAAEVAGRDGVRGA
jgi:hypothetical protein